MDCSLPGSSSMEFSRTEYWSGLQWPPPGDLPNPGIEPSSLLSPEFSGRFFTTNTTWEAPTLYFYWSRILGACLLSKGTEKKKTGLVLSRSSSVSHPCFCPYHLLPCWKQSRTSLISPLKDWCWRWSSNTLATWCNEPTHWKRPWYWERLGAKGEGSSRGWDGWMASLTQRTWIEANSGR